MPVKTVSKKKKKKILIIEDYPATVELMNTLLSPNGFEIIVACDGKIGIEKAVSEKPDLILLDVMMPEMGGIEVLKKLMSNPKTAKIPVVIVSVRVGAEDIRAGKDAGAVEYIGKPFEPAELLEIAKKHLG
ncbi:MAG: response regulator [Candidatus Margulisiibacteriota bacterium]